MKSVASFLHTTSMAASMALSFVVTVGSLVPQAHATSPPPPDSISINIIDCPVPGEIEGRPGYGLYINRNTGQITAVTNQGGFVGGSTNAAAKIGLMRNSQGSCMVQIKDNEASPSYYHVRTKQVYLGGKWRSCQISDFYNDYLNQQCDRLPENPNPQGGQPGAQTGAQPGTQVAQTSNALCGNEFDRNKLMFTSMNTGGTTQAVYDSTMSRLCPREYKSAPGSADNRNNCMTESGRYVRVLQYSGSAPSCGGACARDYVLAQVCPNYSQVQASTQPAQQQPVAPAQDGRSWWQRGDTSEFTNSHSGVR